MIEAKQARGDAVFQGLVSPGLETSRERLLFAVAMGLTLAFLLVHKTGITLFDDPWADIEAPVAITTVQSLGAARSLGSSRQANTPAEAPDQPEKETFNWLELEVAGGDTLARIFKRAGYDERLVHHLVNQSEEGASLARIFPGQVIAFRADEEGQLLGVRHIKSPLEMVTYQLTDNGVESTVDVRSPDPREAWTTGVIKSSLFLAGEEAGLSQGMIMDMANIFGGVVDFALDPRRGDTMQLLYEELFLDGEKLRDGDIIAASFTNQGETFNAFRYTDSTGDTNYYNEDGVSMKKSFLMAPLDFTRISSNFNMRRLHPIYKTTRPHRGTDYAAPTGTPVYAAGDGRVVKAGYTRTNGNYVFIQHGEQYVTRYLHLHKRKVNAGQRVSQNQLIGTVGATGAATGPHLHYEFLVNGVHRNPRTIYKELPKAKKLPDGEMARFEAAIARANHQLTALRSSDQLAMNDLPESKTAPN
jgi:murein DD-endopeptidase MepM/ murein hydrolase activator NlpD